MRGRSLLHVHVLRVVVPLVHLGKTKAGIGGLLLGEILLPVDGRILRVLALPTHGDGLVLNWRYHLGRLLLGRWEVARRWLGLLGGRLQLLLLLGGGGD